MSGMIGVIAQDNARYTMFMASVMLMQHPPNTQIEFGLSSDRIAGRNKVAEKALERGAEWLLFLDDDHTFPTDLLPRLLAHDLPVVGALYLQRMQPFSPVAYTHKLDTGHFVPIILPEHHKDEVVPVAAMGTGGMLIRSEVFDAMEYPWFQHGTASEDIIFCERAIELGFTVHCDLATRMGHMGVAATWPTTEFDEDGVEVWCAGFQFADGFSVKVPIGAPVETEIPQGVSDR